jgi:hypothetical protein
MCRFHSDRYFIQALLFGMHPSFCSVLETSLHNRLAQVGRRDLPLPRALSPGQILQTMVEIGVDQRVLKLDALSSCDITNRCPAAALPAIMVNQVHGSPSDSEDEEDDKAPPTTDVLSSEDSINLLVMCFKAVSATTASPLIMLFATVPLHLIKSRVRSSRRHAPFACAQKHNPAIRNH